MNIGINPLPVLMVLVLLNLRTFGLMWKDKKIAQKQDNSPRISERKLLVSAFFLGSMGIWLGMHVFRHKTRNNKFRLGVPLMLIVQVVLGVLLINQFEIHWVWASIF